MAKKTVLAIGIEPSLVDFSAFPGLTAELVTSYIKAQIEKLRAMGYEADSCLIDLGDTAEAVAAAALGAKHYDCVVIGAGLREPRERLHYSNGSSIWFTSAHRKPAFVSTPRRPIRPKRCGDGSSRKRAASSLSLRSGGGFDLQGDGHGIEKRLLVLEVVVVTSALKFGSPS